MMALMAPHSVEWSCVVCGRVLCVVGCDMIGENGRRGTASGKQKKALPPLPPKSRPRSSSAAKRALPPTPNAKSPDKRMSLRERRLAQGVKEEKKEEKEDAAGFHSAFSFPALLTKDMLLSGSGEPFLHQGGGGGGGGGGGEEGKAEAGGEEASLRPPPPIAFNAEGGMESMEKEEEDDEDEVVVGRGDRVLWASSLCTHEWKGAVWDALAMGEEGACGVLEFKWPRDERWTRGWAVACGGVLIVYEKQIAKDDVTLPRPALVLDMTDPALDLFIYSPEKTLINIRSRSPQQAESDPDAGASSSSGGNSGADEDGGYPYCFLRFSSTLVHDAWEQALSP